MRAFAGAHVALLLASLSMFASDAEGAVMDAVRLSRAAGRCIKLAELISCDEALNMKPNDPGLLVAEADALVQMKRPGEAIGVYRNALRSGATEDVVDKKIALAQSQRESFLQMCVTQPGEVAERACESAWLPGAPDEVTVFKRRGLLLQGEGRLSAALDAYMAVARLRPADRGVARTVISLSGVVGRKDALTLSARGIAFMSLGRRAEGITSLREAVRLSPNLAEAKSRLRAAERAAAADAAAGPPVSGTPPRPRSDASIGPYTNEAEVTRSN